MNSKVHAPLLPPVLSTSQQHCEPVATVADIALLVNVPDVFDVVMVTVALVGVAASSLKLTTVLALFVLLTTLTVMSLRSKLKLIGSCLSDSVVDHSLALEPNNAP